MKGIFLGTSSMVPTRKRNVSSIYVEQRKTVMLVDCGEGTQRQMNICGLNRHRISLILITHWHGDHVSGLVGLLQTMGKIPNPNEVTIIGPEGTKEYMHHVEHSTASTFQTPLNIVESNGEGETVFANKDVEVTSHRLEHGVPCNGYVVQKPSTRRILMEDLSKHGVTPGPHIGRLQKGEDIEYEGKTYRSEEFTYVEEGSVLGFIIDTKPCTGVENIMEASDTVVCEATFTSEHSDRARKYSHMTAKQAARIARSSSVDKLYLTHFSQRYPDVSVVENEAKEVFPQSYAAHDFMEFTSE